MREVKAPQRWYRHPGEIILFPGGSIEQGAAEKWQSRLVDSLSDFDNLIILNPRRDHWDSTWEQSISNPQFREQVEWELHAQERADIIVYYFDPTTKSPITLLELGLFHNKSNLIVCCPPGFWRKGNVEVVCAWESIMLVEDFGTMVDAVKAVISQL